MTQAVVLHSGGLDSTVCLLMAQKKWGDILSLGFEYGQRHRIELEFADQQCRKWGIPRQVISVKWERAHKAVPLDRAPEEIRRSVSPAFLQGRNLVFLSTGLAQAATLGAKELWIGVNSIDFSGYPDCTPEFIASFDETAQRGVPGGPVVKAPLQLMTKPEIALKAQELGLGMGDTWSCYTPQLVEGRIAPCGRCDACVLHSYAWRQVFSATQTEPPK